MGVWVSLCMGKVWLERSRGVLLYVGISVYLCESVPVCISRSPCLIKYFIINLTISFIINFYPSIKP